MFRPFFTHFGVPVLATAVAISLGGTAAAAPQEHGHGGGHGGGGHGGGGHVEGYHGGSYHGGGDGRAWSGYRGGYGYGGHGWGGYGRGWGGYGYGRDWGYRGYGRGWGYGGYWPYYSGLGLSTYWGWPAYYGGYSSYYYSPSYYGYLPSYNYGLSTYPYDTSDYSYPDAGYTTDQPAPSTTYREPYPDTANEPSSVDPNAALVRVRVPADATLWFENEQTHQTGPIREFVTPPLTPGNEYTYQIRAQWMQDGRPAESSRDVLIRAGDRLTIDMTRTSTGAAGPNPAAVPLPGGANRPPRP